MAAGSSALLSAQTLARMLVDGRLATLQEKFDIVYSQM